MSPPLVKAATWDGQSKHDNKGYACAGRRHSLAILRPWRRSCLSVAGCCGMIGRKQARPGRRDCREPSTRRYPNCRTGWRCGYNAGSGIAEPHQRAGPTPPAGPGIKPFRSDNSRHWWPAGGNPQRPRLVRPRCLFRSYLVAGRGHQIDVDTAGTRDRNSQPLLPRSLRTRRGHAANNE